MKLKNLILLLMIITLISGVSGCGIFSPDPGGGGGGGGGGSNLEYPSNPDLVMKNFEQIYIDTNIDDFRKMLHTEYKTVLLPSTIQEWEEAGNPLAADVFYRDDEINIHENMFSGNTGINANGGNIDPITSINVDYLTKNGSWEPIPESDEFFAGYGGYSALFNVLIYFNNPDQHRFEVQQDVKFYVVPTDDDGRTKWLLLGQRGYEPSS